MVRLWVFKTFSLSLSVELEIESLKEGVVGSGERDRETDAEILVEAG